MSLGSFVAPVRVAGATAALLLGVVSCGETEPEPAVVADDSPASEQPDDENPSEAPQDYLTCIHGAEREISMIEGVPTSDVPNGKSVDEAVAGDFFVKQYFEKAGGYTSRVVDEQGGQTSVGLSPRGRDAIEFLVVLEGSDKNGWRVTYRENCR